MFFSSIFFLIYGIQNHSSEILEEFCALFLVISIGVYN